MHLSPTQIVIPLRYSVTLFRYVFQLQSIIQLHTNSSFLHHYSVECEWLSALVSNLRCYSVTLFRYVIPLRYSVTVSMSTKNADTHTHIGDYIIGLENKDVDIVLEE